MTLYVIRHPLTESNKQRILQGHADSPITAEGERTAHVLGKALRGTPLARIYTSDLGRCLQTTAIVNGYLHLPVVPTPALREQDFGALNGQPRNDEILFLESHPDAVPPGGESLLHVKARVVDFVRVLPAEDALLVTHNGCFQSLLAEAQGVDPLSAQCSTTPWSIGVFTVTPQRLELVRLWRLPEEL